MTNADRQFLWVSSRRQSQPDSRRTSRDEHRLIHSFVQSYASSQARFKAHDSVAFSIREGCPTDEQGYDTQANQANVMSKKVPNISSAIGSSFDPFFMSTIIPMTNPLHALMTYSRECILIGAGSYKTEVFAVHLQPFRNVHRAAAEYAISKALQYKHVMFPILAAFSQRTRCRQQYPFTNLFDPGRFLQSALIAVKKAISAFFRQQSIESTRYELAESLATGICFLIFATGMSGRLEESKSHIIGLLSLLPQLRAESLTYHWLVDNATTFDLLHSARSRTYPATIPATITSRNTFSIMTTARREELRHLASMLRVDQQYLTESRVFIESSEQYQQSANIFMKYDLLTMPEQDLTIDLGTLLLHPSTISQLQPELVRITCDVIECLDIARLVWHRPNLVNSNDSSWMCQRARNLWADLLRLLADNDSSDSGHSEYYHTCFLTTLLILLEGACQRALHLTRISHVVRLRTSLQNLFQNNCDSAYSSSPGPNVQDTDDCWRMSILWMLFTGFWAGQHDPSGEWCKQQTISMARAMGLKSHLDIHQILSKYLYSKTVQYVCLAEIVKCIPQT